MIRDASDVYELVIAIVLLVAGSSTLIQWARKNVKDRKFKPIATDWAELWIAISIYSISVAYIGLVFNWNVLAINSHTLNETGKYFSRTGITAWSLLTIIHSVNGNLNSFIDNTLTRMKTWIGRD